MPNPAPGNKPICVGHQYSLLTMLPNTADKQEKTNWQIPLNIKRVASKDKGNEIGMQQIKDCIKNLSISDDLNISVGDSLYGTSNCRQTICEEKNLVHIFRLNSKRNIFSQPNYDIKTTKNTKTRSGRKREFGEKMALNNTQTHSKCDEQLEFNYLNKKNKKYTVLVKCWKNKLLRGTKEFKSSGYPINLIQIEVFHNKKKVYKRPLWLAIFGRRRQEISLNDACNNYFSRYDIEHLFRFTKNNLLLDKYQTPEAENEQAWLQFCLLAYTQLYLSKDDVLLTPQPWERYLSEYKEIAGKNGVTATPSQTQKGFEKILKKIGSPAAECKQRGIPDGRKKGDKQEKRKTHEIIFKHKKNDNKLNKPNKTESEKSGPTSDQTVIDKLLAEVHLKIAAANLTIKNFAKMLAAPG